MKLHELKLHKHLGKHLNNFHEKIFYISLYLSYLLYLLALFQLKFYNPVYLDYLESFMKYYVIFFLLLRFNPFRKVTFTEFDRTVVFSSAIFLLTTTTFSDLAKSFEFTELINLIKL